MNIKAIEIIHSGAKVDNKEVFQNAIPDIDKFIATTGIQYRYVAPKNHIIEDYFVQGIKKITKDTTKIGVIITVTQTPSKLVPSISNYILSKVAFNSSILTYDLISGCSGYTEALALANNLFLATDCHQILICNGDFSTHIISDTNFTTLPLFSDVAAITLLERSDKQLFESNLHTFGEGYSAINSSNNLMTLNGLEVFQYSTLYTAKTISELLNKHSLSSHSIQQFYFHQANLIINKTIQRQLGLPEEKVPFSIFDYGNSSSASIPLTLVTSQVKQKEKQRILLSGFGVGFKVCNVAMETSNFNANISIFESH